MSLYLRSRRLACFFASSLVLNVFKSCAAQFGFTQEYNMAMTPERKTAIIKEYQTDENDTGSPEVQVALLTERIRYLTSHVQTHHKDNHSRRGLLKLVGQRRRLLRYVKNVDENRYKSLIKRLGLRR